MLLPPESAVREAGPEPIPDHHERLPPPQQAETPEGDTLLHENSPGGDLKPTELGQRPRGLRERSLPALAGPPQPGAASRRKGAGRRAPRTHPGSETQGLRLAGRGPPSRLRRGDQRTPPVTRTSLPSRPGLRAREEG